ncbi:MAG TPA: ATP-dependent DNA helicase RecG [Bacillota bacterium]|nr:ATP-dependent DNA helicase RecG [Bacillota bacterium]
MAESPHQLAASPLHLPVLALPGVGPSRAARLAALGVATVGDMLRLAPRRYEDRTHVTPLAEALHQAAAAAGEPAEPALFRVQVHAVTSRRPRPGLALLLARVADGSAAIEAVWFNQPHIQRLLRPGAWLYLFGRLQWSRGRPQLAAAEVEPDDGSPALAGRLVPVYPLTAGLTQRAVRMLVRAALTRAAGRIEDPLPGDLREHLGLPHAAAALHTLHDPPDAAALAGARRRLAFEELLLLQIGLGLRRRSRESVRRAFRYAPAGESSRAFRAALPFALTGAQSRVLREIEADLQRARPMYRLLQGDVGSGKTVVAAAALLRAIESGRQAALMAPTEILAEQHYARIGPWLGALGARVRLLTGRTGAAQRRQILSELASAGVDLVVGTHALIQDGVEFAALGLVVTDEQHRFGVRQRDTLVGKGERPDVLAMTATPIPRTLAFTLYGDLDVSALDEMPPGRRPVRTHWREPERRGGVYEFVGKELAAGRQAFVVCPMVNAEEGDDELAAVTEWSQELRKKWLPGARIAPLHGRMPGAEKDRVMRAFAAAEIQCLVATTVIEVGIDVPNASVMVIEGADRFGLAQLHQLRGRVGRGPYASWCVLIAPDRGGPVTERLRTLERTQDGFAIAEADLKLRGPGELLGLRQHGLPELQFADLSADLHLLTQARDVAAQLLAGDPRLRAPEHQGIRTAVGRLFGDVVGWEA